MAFSKKEIVPLRKQKILRKPQNVVLFIWAATILMINLFPKMPPYLIEMFLERPFPYDTQTLNLLLASNAIFSYCVLSTLKKVKEKKSVFRPAIVSFSVFLIGSAFFTSTNMAFAFWWLISAVIYLIIQKVLHAARRDLSEMD